MNTRSRITASLTTLAAATMLSLATADTASAREIFYDDAPIDVIVQVQQSQDAHNELIEQHQVVIGEVVEAHEDATEEAHMVDFGVFQTNQDVTEDAEVAEAY